MLIPTEFVFQTEDKRYGLIIDREFITLALTHCQRAAPNETGGIIAGHYTKDLKWAIVTNLSGPTADSVRRRYSFFRGIKGLQKWLNSIWKKKEHYYLGEWHFHPFASPIPSQRDNVQMLRFANNQSLRCPEPILMIIGGYPDGEWSMKTFVYMKSEMHELKCLAFPEIGSKRL